ncbi:hypothetical protein C7437_101620 [Psychrobacillus insolitus]|uniref:rRNA methyltransferase n=1 Tax=Psychrobacillus insolitus TaxID=1461 RepID=A0A2W7N695_9BACI|nr:rRNA methyltransferase [Psychrobacillus insolitus]PZX07503.1 hypothetical protein C7437_101620 [Psychrobacillus insolitus]
MWKLVNGKLVQSVDESRSEYKTRISAVLIQQLKLQAKESNTHIGYLLESGFENILNEDAIIFDKKNRPKDRVDFRTTCDKDILNKLKIFAKKNTLNLNDVIEASVAYIDKSKVKNVDWRYRTEIQ